MLKNMFYKKRLVCWFLILLLLILITGCGKYDFGVIKTPDGEPVANAEIVVGDNEYFTNENGYFVLKDIEEGEYTLTVRKDGYQEKQIELEADGKSRKIGEIIIEPKN